MQGTDERGKLLAASALIDEVASTLSAARHTCATCRLTVWEDWQAHKDREVLEAMAARLRGMASQIRGATAGGRETR